MLKKNGLKSISKIKEEFDPFKSILKLLKTLSEKEKTILIRHFGIKKDKEAFRDQNKGKDTLESIGKTYNLTRERIRQIENQAVEKIRQDKNYKKFIVPLENLIAAVLKKHGGIMRENELLKEILGSQDRGENRRTVLFLMKKFFSDKFNRVKLSKDFFSSWKLKSLSFEFLKNINQEIKRILEKERRTLTFDEIWRNFQRGNFYKKHKQKLSKEILLSCLKSSRCFDLSPFNDWGLVSWGIINLKRMSNKIYVVLKEANKPLHFREITELINQKGFSNKLAHAPTVHNELVADNRYVLVGRGVYALTEWGYLPGTTVDLIEKVLKEKGGRAHKNEIIKDILKQRAIKKGTVLTILANKNRFKKLSDGRYTIVSK